MPHRKPPPNRKIKTAKRRAMAQGLRAETLAAFYLRLKGYRILARNLRVAGGEVDMVARRGNVLVFVEVKYRPSLGAAQAVMHDAQWRRIARAAAQYVGARPALQRHHWRFDLIAMAPRQRPRHIKDAWRAPF